MTREGLVKHWDVIQAFKDGKKVQRFSTISGYWVEETEPTFNCDNEYRIKPEHEIIPFDFSDAEMLIGKVVKRKDGSKYVQIIVQVQPDIIYIGAGVITFQNLFESCVFSDNTPCGKQKV